MKKIIFLIFFFYLLAMLQSSFLVSFSKKGAVLNFVLIGVILVNLLFCQHRYLGIAGAFFAGFFLDVFSTDSYPFFGFFTLISIIIALFVKLILKYVRFPAVRQLQ